MKRISSLVLCLLFGTFSTQSALTQDNDIVDTAIAAGSFTTLVTAVQAAGLEGALRGPGPFTVFAPTDDAFAAVPAETLDFLLANPEELRKVLLYHVVAGQVLAETVVTINSAETLLGEEVAISVDSGSVKVNQATVLATDIVASNGVIHVIDSVLLPPEETLPDIVDTAVAAGDFTTLVTALQLTGLDEALRGAGPFTVFAPNDAAFAKLPAGTLEALIADPEALADILLFHVVSGNFQAGDVLARNQLPTLQGARAGISLKDGNAFIEDAQIIATDIGTSNGTIHVIDSVILPPSIGGVTYEVTLINGTTNQVFTPPLLVSHLPAISPFQVGEPASAGLARLAQEGDSETLVDELYPLDQVFDIVTASEPIGPGQRATYNVQVSGRFNEISILGMLATTNDTFFAGSVTAPRVFSLKNSPDGPEVNARVEAYDAGAEYNSENCTHIPGPPCNNADAAPAQSAEGFVNFANGIHGDGDLEPKAYDWRGSVAILRVRPLN